MTWVGIGLVLLSALLHAYWNFLLKRAGATGVAFIWLFRIPAVVLLAPIAIVLIHRQDFSFVEALPWLVGSAVIHIGYFMVLQRGYVYGDLSVVYPVARGVGPLLASLAAIVLFRERPSILAAVGGIAIIGGALALAVQSLGGTRARRTPASVGYGLAVGAFIGVYTVWDKFLVSTLQVPPLVVDWSLSVAIALLVTPAALQDRRALAGTWHRHGKTAVVTGLLSSLSYILFLTALRILPVTRAAPLRETSVLMGAFLGAHMLGEGKVRHRIAAAAVIMIGIVLLSLG